MATQRAQTTWQRGTTFRGALRVDQVAEGFTVDENTNVTFVGKCVDDPNVDLEFVNAGVDQTFTTTYEAETATEKARLVFQASSDEEPEYGWMLIGARFDFGGNVIEHSRTQLAVKVVRKF